MSSQKELAWSMRGILLTRLVQVHAHFHLLPETFLCINITDHFLSARAMSLAKLQLVGITCLFISKAEEIVVPSASHFLHCANSSYTESEILLAERYVLKNIKWNMSFPKPNAPPPSYQQDQQLQHQGSNHRQVSTGSRGTQMEAIGHSSVFDGGCIDMVSPTDSWQLQMGKYMSSF